MSIRVIITLFVLFSHLAVPPVLAQDNSHHRDYFSSENAEALDDSEIAYAIEVASLKPRTEILDIYEKLQRSFHHLLKSYKPIIEPMDYNGNTPYSSLFRLRMGYMENRIEAEGICLALKRRGYKDICNVKFHPR